MFIALGMDIAAIVLIELSNTEGALEGTEFAVGASLGAVATVVIYISSLMYYHHTVDALLPLIDEEEKLEQGEGDPFASPTYLARRYVRDSVVWHPVMITVSTVLWTIGMVLVFNLELWTALIGAFVLAVALACTVFLIMSAWHERLAIAHFTVMASKIDPSGPNDVGPAVAAAQKRAHAARAARAAASAEGAPGPRVARPRQLRARGLPGGPPGGRPAPVPMPAAAAGVAAAVAEADPFNTPMGSPAAAPAPGAEAAPVPPQQPVVNPFEDSSDDEPQPGAGGPQGPPPAGVAAAAAGRAWVSGRTGVSAYACMSRPRVGDRAGTIPASRRAGLLRTLHYTG